MAGWVGWGAVKSAASAVGRFTRPASTPVGAAGPGADDLHVQPILKVAHLSDDAADRLGRY